MYGWDSYSTLKNTEDQTDQSKKTQILRQFITITLEEQVKLDTAFFGFSPTFLFMLTKSFQDKNNTILGSSIFSFADIYHAAEDEKYVYGDPSVTCPDVNAWLQVIITFYKLNRSVRN